MSGLSNVPSGLGSIPGADAAIMAEQQMNAETARAQKILEEAEKTKKEAELLQHYVHLSANPHPIVIALIIFGVFVGLWLLNIIFLKPSVSGEWLNTTGQIWRLSHNKFTGDVCVKTDTSSGTGEISDNLFMYNGIIGIWNYSDVILFVDGGGMQRIHN